MGLWLHGLHPSRHASCHVSSVSLVVRFSRVYGLGSSRERVGVCVVVGGYSFSVLYIFFPSSAHTDVTTLSRPWFRVTCVVTRMVTCVGPSSFRSFSKELRPVLVSLRTANSTHMQLCSLASSALCFGPYWDASFVHSSL